MRPRKMAVSKAKEALFVVAFIASIIVALGTLAILLGAVIGQALPYMKASVIVNYANFHDPSAAGYSAAIVGTAWIVGLTMLFSLPLGIGAAIYLEEYGGQRRTARFLQAAVTNLAGVPSVVFGLLGLALFVRPPLNLGSTVLSGSLTMTMLVFPYVVISTQEAIRAVPSTVRESALALGATKWQTIKHQVMPAAAPGLLTGTILTASRAIGETAPLIVIGAVALQTFLPYGPGSPFVALPVQIYAYIGLPGNEWRGVAAAGMVILLAMLFTFNLAAILARNRLQRLRW